MRLVLTGELDLATAASLGQALARHAGRGAHLVVDFNGLDFIDSSGLNVLVRAHDAARSDGWRMMIVAESPAIRRPFELMGLDNVLDFIEGPPERRS